MVNHRSDVLLPLGPEVEILVSATCWLAWPFVRNDIPPSLQRRKTEGIDYPFLAAVVAVADCQGRPLLLASQRINSVEDCGNSKPSPCDVKRLTGTVSEERAASKQAVCSTHNPLISVSDQLPCRKKSAARY